MTKAVERQVTKYGIYELANSSWIIQATESGATLRRAPEEPAAVIVRVVRAEAGTVQTATFDKENLKAAEAFEKEGLASKLFSALLAVNSVVGAYEVLGQKPSIGAISRAVYSVLGDAGSLLFMALADAPTPLLVVTGVAMAAKGIYAFASLPDVLAGRNEARAAVVSEKVAEVLGRPTGVAYPDHYGIESISSSDHAQIRLLLRKLFKDVGNLKGEVLKLSYTLEEVREGLASLPLASKVALPSVQPPPAPVGLKRQVPTPFFSVPLAVPVPLPAQRHLLPEARNPPQQGFGVQGVVPPAEAKPAPEKPSFPFELPISPVQALIPIAPLLPSLLKRAEPSAREVPIPNLSVPRIPPPKEASGTVERYVVERQVVRETVVEKVAEREEPDCCDPLASSQSRSFKLPKAGRLPFVKPVVALPDLPTVGMAGLLAAGVLALAKTLDWIEFNL